jgi:isorenieratene synthase
MTDPRRDTLPAPPGLPTATALWRRPHVVVVGAGIAGLAAPTGGADGGDTGADIVRVCYWGGRGGGWTETR